MMDVPVCVMFSAAVLIRFVLLCFGVYQDQNLTVKYTDVDYHVFTDAARFITQGASPYNRSTFRYTPLLAFILTPNILLNVHCGKLLFCAADLLCGLLIFRLLALRGVSRSSAYVYCGLWLLNPLPIGVSTRGNAESLLAALVLSTLLCLESKRRTAAALLFGLSVHMKIYPVTYALPITLSLVKPASARGFFQNFMRCFNKDIVLFPAVSASVFFSLNLTFYYIGAALEWWTVHHLFPAAVSPAARLFTGVSQRSSVLLFHSHRCVCQLQQSVHFTVFSLVSVFTAAGFASSELQFESRVPAAAVVVCWTGCVVDSCVLSGV
ncbi:GPI mannosyltransferase 1 isoform X2 [Myxocyprinus asiaticus]|uniref:GPI mannosyltransferase 1 isoform X2 n=1 Tax=Myxocyprinus asiaticus TaxID=70543 RepID=UPI0022221EA4|nr:GPI mannosyltransferase 1 isoform X2 [Myxocyprinus asiaticus]